MYGMHTPVLHALAKVTVVKGLHVQFSLTLPDVMYNYDNRSFVEVYGEVYFRAWRLASGPYLKQLEEFCLQDLMYSAVHAPRHGLHSLFHSLRKVKIYSNSLCSVKQYYDVYK